MTGGMHAQSEGKLSAAGSAFAAPQSSHGTSTASRTRGSMNGAVLPVGSVDTSRTGSATAVPVPPAGAPLATLVAFIQSQLDTIGPDDIVLAQYKLQGATPSDRRVGSALPPSRQPPGGFHA